MTEQNIFVPQDEALAQLEEKYKDALKGCGSVIFLTGESGIGKTTMVEHITSLLEICPPTRFVSMQCPYNEKGTVTGYETFSLLFKNYFEQLTGKDANRLDKAIYSFILEHKAELLPDILALIPGLNYVAVAAKYGLKYMDSRMVNDPKSLADHGKLKLNEVTSEKFVDAIRKLAKKQPLILSVDDAQWADPSSCTVIYSLTEELKKMQALLLVSFRPQDAAAEDRPIKNVFKEIKTSKNGWQEIPLPRFNLTKVMLYLQRRFPKAGYEVSSKLTQWLYDITDGHPGFIHEYIEMLREKHLLDKQGKLTVPDLDQVDVPKKLSDLYQERVKQLDDELNRVLRYASTEGYEFTRYMVETLLEERRTQTQDIFTDFRKLEEAHRLIKSLGLTQVYNRETSVFQFQNKSLHQYVLSNMNPEERKILQKILYRKLSEVAAQTSDLAIKDQLSSRMAMLAGQIDEHYCKAITILDQAKRAAERYALPELKEACKAGLEALERAEHTYEVSRDTQMTRLEFTLLMGRAEDLALEHTAAERTYQQCVRMAQALGEKNKEAQAYNRLGYLYMWNHRGPNNVKAMHEKAFKLLQELGTEADQVERITALLGIGGILSRKQKTQEEAKKLYEEALTIAISIKDHRHVASCYHNIATLLKDEGEQLKYYQKALDLAEEYELPPYERGNTYANMGWIFFQRKEYETAIDHFHKALAVQVGVNDSHTAYAYRGLALSLTWLNDYTLFVDAARYLNLAVEAALKNNDKEEATLAYIDLGDVYRVLGDYEQSIEVLERALDGVKKFSKADQKILLNYLYERLSDSYRKVGNYKKAVEAEMLREQLKGS